MTRIQRTKALLAQLDNLNPEDDIDQDPDLGNTEVKSQATSVPSKCPRDVTEYHIRLLRTLTRS